MGWVLAKVYDPIMQGSERACLGAWRASLLADVGGRVLEIGAGTGRSLPHYSEAITQLVLLEPDPHMRRRLVRRVPARLAGVAEVVPGDAAQLAFDDGSFDAVVSSLVLCSVSDLPGTLAELHRVLAPGGRLVFVEHVADDARPGRLRWQRRLEPVWKRLVGGCHLTRRTHDAIADAGFVVESLTTESMRKANPLVRHSVRGIAVKPG
ncbi:MAG: class I SAM-dependent methyltransferase [Myxococcota bacterium]